MTASNQSDSNEAFAGQMLPQLRPKRPIPARGVLSPPRSTQEVQPLSRRTRLSNAAAEVPCTRFIEVSLYCWSVVAITLGVALACFVLYMMYFKDGGNLTPTLPFNLAAYGGLVIVVSSGFGLYGLLHHRKIVTEGQRNYALGMFIVVGIVGAIVIIAAGAMALSLVHIVDDAREEDFTSDQVAVLETNVITRLHAQVMKSASSWQDTQNSLKCCGYDQVRRIQGYLSPSSSWDTTIETAIQDINAVGGRYCSSRVSECMNTTSESHCPVSGRDWCRHQLLQVARENYSLLSICALTFGAVQVLFSAFGLFTLLCDVRRISGLSPIYEIQHQTLSPIQPNARNVQD